MATLPLRLVACLALPGLGLAGCSGSNPRPDPTTAPPTRTGRPAALPTCTDIVRNIPRNVLAVKDDHDDAGPTGRFGDPPRVYDLDCQPVFGRLSDGGSGIASVSVTRAMAPTINGKSRASFLGSVITNKMRDNVCLSDQINPKGDPPTEARCFDPASAAPLAALAVVRGDLAIVVGISGPSLTPDNAVQQRRLLESAAQKVVNATARIS